MAGNRLLMGLCLLTLGAGQAPAAYEFHAVTENSAISEDCRVAANPAGEAVVAWHEAGHVFSRAWLDGALAPPVDHGEGSGPSVAWNAEGFWIAWADAAGIWIRVGDGNAWSAPELIAAQLDPPVANLHLAGSCPPHWNDDLYLTFSDEDGAVWFRPRHQGAWWWQVVWVIDTDSYEPPLTRCVPTGAGYQIYYSTSEGIFAMGNYGEAEPVGMPDTHAGDFDAACDGELGTHVLSTGIQPTCPCNHMLYTYLPDEVWPPPVWTDPVDLTVYYDAYTWPRRPTIACDSQGDLHAFWFQRHADGMMQESFRGVFYFTRVNGEWTDRTGILQDHGAMARDPHMALGAGELPVFVFARDEDPGFNVWLAIDRTATAVTPPPAAGPRLSAYPNPFNPATTIRYEHGGGPVTITVHDVAGRRLRTLFAGESAGAVTIEWDGRDGAGRAMPAGVYLLRAGVAGGGSSVKLLLLP